VEAGLLARLRISEYDLDRKTEFGDAKRERMQSRYELQEQEEEQGISLC